MDNDNPTPCENCETQNTPESIFCKLCGRRLSGAAIGPALDAGIRNEIDSLVKAKMEQMTEFAARLEDKIELSSRQKIDGWFKGGILGSVLVVAVGGWSLKDTMQQTAQRADEAKQQIKQIKEELDQAQKEAVNQTIDISKIVKDTLTQMDKFDEIQKDLNKKDSDILSKYEMMNQNFEEAKKEFEEIRSLRTKTKTYASEVTDHANKTLEKIQRTENATFDVFVDIAGKPDNEPFLLVKDKLLEKGFRINSSNVMDSVEVNYNEIVYFSDLNTYKAEEIMAILKPYYKDIRVNLKKNSDRNDRDILLKLKSGTH